MFGRCLVNDKSGHRGVGLRDPQRVFVRLDDRGVDRRAVPEEVDHGVVEEPEDKLWPGGRISQLTDEGETAAGLDMFLPGPEYGGSRGGHRQPGRHGSYPRHGGHLALVLALVTRRHGQDLETPVGTRHRVDHRETVVAGERDQAVRQDVVVVETDPGNLK